ncbi:MAG: DEAD/DEAH box helicase, partial [Planctomycetaceae bacterium]
MNQPNPQLSREELALAYLEQLPFVPYPVQERALLAWFETSEGILVSAPTGTGKTLIAEAAVYEALRTGRRMYYTTPLIALTEQNFGDHHEDGGLGIDPAIARDKTDLLGGASPADDAVGEFAELLLGERDERRGVVH